MVFRETRRKNTHYRTTSERFNKLIAIFGFIIGILSIIAAYYAVVTSHYDRFIIVLLAVIGVALGIAPVTKFLIAELFSVIAGISIVMLVVSFVPPAVWDWLYTSFGIKTCMILLAIFVIVAVLAYTFTKLITGLVKLMGEILTSKPVSIIIGVVAVVQGIMLIFGHLYGSI